MDVAIASVRGNDGTIHGYVLFEQLARGHAQVLFHLHNFEPLSVHGLHIHDAGDLRRGCDSLGGHYNPTGAPHGSFKGPRHSGDLVNNFQANEAGTFDFAYVDVLKVKDLYGRSVVIHAFPDDLGRADYGTFATKELAILCRERSYPERGRRAMVKRLNKESKTTGNSSRRIACGIVGRVATK